MPIHKLHVSNFRGIYEEQEICIKPITIFVGPNSSGKSSCIHALACLSQTMKIIADDRPIILDDEAANVHLGRFIEVIHSKSYQDQIGLGISLRDTTIHMIEPGQEGKIESIAKSGELKAYYNFKCSQRTQKVTLEAFEYLLGEPISSGRKAGAAYTIVYRSGRKQIVSASKAFRHGFIVDDGVVSDALMRSPGTTFPYEFFSLQSAQAKIKDELVKTLYLGPFRQPPSRRYASRGAAPSEVGAMGRVNYYYVGKRIDTVPIPPAS